METPGEIFHYTTISALRGILKDNSLWATHAAHLNDTSETKLIWPWFTQKMIRHYEREIRDLLNSNPDPDALKLTSRGESNLVHLARHDGTAIANEMRTTLLGDGSTLGNAPPFVVSFTTHEGESEREKYHRKNGMLSQWRGYGGNEGVAIVFDTKGLEALLQKECDFFEYWPSCASVERVAYNWQEVPLDVHFPKLSEALQIFVKTFIVQISNEAVVLDSMGKLYDYFVQPVSLLKHIGFHEEQEYRIVVGVTPQALSDKLARAGQDNIKFRKEIHSRQGACGLVPYIRLFEHCRENLPIVRVIVGPSRNQNANLRTVQDLTTARGIAVQVSETPFVEST